MENMTNSLRATSGKYLTFKLANEDYGLEILKVQEIIKLMEITAVPRTPEYVKGVINLRGKVIPVMDLRLKFGLSETDPTEKTCIIVVQISRENSLITIGIIVDEVSEVVDIQESAIEPAPSFSTQIETSFILGMAKVRESVKILLDIDRVLTTGEMRTVSSIG